MWSAFQDHFLRCHVPSTRELFVSQLQDDIKLHGSWGYRLIREAGLAQGLESQLADELDVQRQSWAKVWEEGKVQSVVTDARAHYLKLCAEGKVDSKQGHISVAKISVGGMGLSREKVVGL